MSAKRMTYDFLAEPRGEMLVIDANGYLTSIANPAGETVRMTSSPQGLLTSFADPKGNTSRFTYEASGLLTRDDNAAGGSTTLARTITATGHVVTKTTAEGRVTRYETERLSNDKVRSTTTDPAGLRSTLLTRPDGTSTATNPDGAVLNATFAKHGNGRTALEYTRDAQRFFAENRGLATEVVLRDGTAGLRIQTKVPLSGGGTSNVGGYWTSDGQLVTFWD